MQAQHLTIAACTTVAACVCVCFCAVHSNFMSMLEQQGDHVTKLISHMKQNGLRTLDVKPHAEQEYVDFCIKAAEKAPFMQCVSYYNAEGTARPQDLPYSASSNKYYSQLAVAQQGIAAADAGPFLLD